MDRIIKAFTFKTEVYAEVENDPTFTNTAWIIVAVVSFLNQLGARASTNFGNWLLGAVIGTIFAVLGFAVATYVINLVGRVVFKADVNFGELVRTLGLAYVWQVVGLIGILGAFSVALACITAPVIFIGWILTVVAWFIAVKEALDLDWVPTIVTVVIGWIVLIVVNLLAGALMLAIGITGASLFG
ncbi:MAG: YIP1 family protein [Anaerolineales bacterium]